MNFEIISGAAGPRKMDSTLYLIHSNTIALTLDQGWKYRLVIDITFLAFLLLIIADSLLSIFVLSIIAFSMLLAYVFDS